jgi:ATP-binding cassette subfamily B protein
MFNLLQKLHPSFFSIKRALPFLWESGRGLVLANIALSICQGLLPLLVLYLLKLIVDALAVALKGAPSEVVFDQVLWLIALVGGGMLFMGFCGALSNLVTRIHSRAVTDHMCSILHLKSLEVDLEYYENAQYHDTLHRAQQEAPAQPRAILEALLQIGKNGLTLIAICGVLWWLHWSIIFVLLTAAIPEFLIQLRYAHERYTWKRRITKKERLAWYLNSMIVRDAHAKEIRLFGLGPTFHQWFEDIQKNFRQEAKNIEVRHVLFSMGGQGIATIAMFGLLIFIAYRTLNGVLTIGDMVMYFGAIQRGAISLQAFGNSLYRLYSGNLFLVNFYEFLDLPSKVDSPATPKTLPRPLQQGLMLDHVTFSYPDGTRSVVQDLSLSIRPGEHIALVGKNGVGKTTLVKLLCRLYDPLKGRITLDGIDIREFALADLRAEFSVIFQDFVKYQMTVSKNIWLGNIRQPYDTPLIEAAAAAAGAHEFITRLPQGYHTQLGRLFERGEELSIGEWQKMALARAFLRNSQILVMDEPTSAMDAKAEFELFQRFHQLAKDRMAILISHRLSTVKMVDRIFVLDQGCIVESGTHDELMKRCGPYAELFEIQAQSYR